jgi:di/tricarboxylate transporter
MRAGSHRHHSVPNPGAPTCFSSGLPHPKFNAISLEIHFSIWYKFPVTQMLTFSIIGDVIMLKKIKEFISKETVLCVSAGCAIATMFLVPPDKEYLHYIDFRVLCLLLCLMAVVAGLKAIGIFDWLTYQLLHRINNGHALSVTLILLPFFSSMFVTNDVALMKKISSLDFCLLKITIFTGTI